MSFAAKLLHLASRESVGGRWTESEAFQGPVYKQVGSLSKELKITAFASEMLQTELRPVSFNKRQKNEEAFFQKHSWRAHVSQFPTRELLFPVSVFVFKMQIMLTLHDREF